MIKIGLTGSIATGKSTVSKILAQQNIPIIDADLVARQVVEPNSPTLKAVVERFGKTILTANGELDRKMLGQIVFGHSEQLQALNAIMHPAIRQAIQAQVVSYEAKKTPLIVLDIPLLIERNYQNQVDVLIVVATKQQLQLERLMARDNLDQEAAQRRIDSQMAIDEKIKLADYVVDNNGDITVTTQQVIAILDEIKQKYD